MIQYLKIFDSYNDLSVSDYVVRSLIVAIVVPVLTELVMLLCAD